MFVTNWISTTKIQKISEITNFFRHYFLSRTEVDNVLKYDDINRQLEQICHAFALRHLYGEGIGLHHGSSVLAMRLKEFLRILDVEVIESTLFLRNNQEKTTLFL